MYHFPKVIQLSVWLFVRWWPEVTHQMVQVKEDSCPGWSRVGPHTPSCLPHSWVPRRDQCSGSHSHWYHGSTLRTHHHTSRGWIDICSRHPHIYHLCGITQQLHVTLTSFTCVTSHNNYTSHSHLCDVTQQLLPSHLPPVWRHTATITLTSVCNLCDVTQQLSPSHLSPVWRHTATITLTSVCNLCDVTHQLSPSHMSVTCVTSHSNYHPHISHLCDVTQNWFNIDIQLYVALHITLLVWDSNDHKFQLCKYNLKGGKEPYKHSIVHLLLPPCPIASLSSFWIWTHYLEKLKGSGLKSQFTTLTS